MNGEPERPNVTVAPNTDDREAVLDAVRTAWHMVLPLQKGEDNESWAEVGGDSLDMLKLLARIELLLERPLAHDLVDMEMTPVTLAGRITALTSGG